jgi:D-alanyl-D-alanine carboxypeptidase (penicillin-binding protein 5/6)
MTIKYLPFRYSDGRVHMLQNTNRTMRENWFCTGMKTGYTDAAKHCLVSSGEHNGREVICVILGGSKERVFADSTRMLRWGLGLPQEKTVAADSPSKAKSKPTGKPRKHRTTSSDSRKNS